MENLTAAVLDAKTCYTNSPLEQDFNAALSHLDEFEGYLNQVESSGFHNAALAVNEILDLCGLALNHGALLHPPDVQVPNQDRKDFRVAFKPNLNLTPNGMLQFDPEGYLGTCLTVFKYSTGNGLNAFALGVECEFDEPVKAFGRSASFFKVRLFYAPEESEPQKTIRLNLDEDKVIQLGNQMWKTAKVYTLASHEPIEWNRTFITKPIQVVGV